MTSAQIRQSYLDFFKSKLHTIVPSSSLMPDSPNLLFTNAGMNQFVPIFLGQKKADVSKWAGAVPGSDTRAADTQKCIRAGGKHNDLDDVGLDTYHHTFFEMLGNWSFGDYFKKEAIDWAWELVTEVWRFPKDRIYATVYKPDPSKGDPSEFDQEAWDIWAEKFRAAGLDPAVHIVYGNKKDNFWMMGDTGPCGPCSELHVDLTPAGDTKGSLVNKGDARCIEIWNLVFIQYNANPDGTFSPLPAKHVDTGMGFERVTSIIQGTQGFKDFAKAKISNYETDIFRPIFDAIEKLSGKKYGSTLPKTGSTGDNAQEKEDVAFRVIADHIRTLSFAIADGIQPGNTDRNYVLRRILRRAVRYGRTLGFKEPFFYKLVDVLADTMGDVFPEIRSKKKLVQETIQREEVAFNKTLDNGIKLFEGTILEFRRLKEFLKELPSRLTRVSNELNSIPDSFPVSIENLESVYANFLTEVFNASMDGKYQQGSQNESDEQFFVGITSQLAALTWSNNNWQIFCDPVKLQYEALQRLGNTPIEFEECRERIRRELANLEKSLPQIAQTLDVFPGIIAFRLADTSGFPLDLTELMARERGLSVDKEGFNKLMDEQKARARAAQKKEVISLSQIETTTPTNFVGYDNLSVETKVLEVVSLKDKTAVVLDTSACYAEMGGQVGDTGELTGSGQLWRVVNTQKSGNTWLHFVEGGDAPSVGATITLAVDAERRSAIQRHHTVTHLLHWALHEVASQEASQKGSSVTPEKLTFDFNSAALTASQVADIEKLVNERILENAGVSWTEVPHADVKNRKDVMQFFGDKYGDVVRVVQIGGQAHKLNGYSMELCGGTHTRATGEIGLFRIVSEAAVAAGVRRIEAVAGLSAFDSMKLDRELIRAVAGKVNSPIHELEKKIETLLAHQKELEKSLRTAYQKEAAGTAKELAARVETLNGVPVILANLGAVPGDTVQSVVDALKSQFKGVIVLGGAADGAVTLIAAVTPEFTAKIQAGKIIQAIAPIVGGKGGGKPDNARGGGKDAGKLDEALAKARTLI